MSYDNPESKAVIMGIDFLEFVKSINRNYVKKSGDTMEGILKAQNNKEYKTFQVRNISLSTTDPTPDEGEDGDIVLIYASTE